MTFRRGLGLILCAALGFTGCVKRAILIRSDPPGATVRINGHEAGVTPLEYPFVTHGRYHLTISKPGFREITARERVNAPWHQWIPIDFFTELLIPVPFDDQHHFSYALQPATPAERTAAEPPPPIDELTTTFRGSSDPARRRAVCYTMVEHRMTAGVPVLKEAVKDPDAEVRATILQALRVLAGPEATPFLVEALQHDQDSVVRWQAAAELEVLKAPEGYAPLHAALKDRDPLVRAAAIEALKALANPSAGPAIVKRLRDPDIVVRRSAASALGYFTDASVIPALSRALRDPDPDVRRRASKSLALLRAAGASRALARALRDQDRRVRETVVDALRQFGTPEAVPVAMRYVRAWSPATRASAAKALGGLKDPRAVPELQRAVRREPNLYTRYEMAQALVNLGAMPSAELASYVPPPVPEKPKK